MPAPNTTNRLDFDVQEFMHFLDDTDWTDTEKEEYLELLWSIVCEFVSIGFGQHPTQQAEGSCGQLFRKMAENGKNNVESNKYATDPPLCEADAAQKGPQNE